MTPEQVTLYSNMYISAYSIYSNIQCVMICTNVKYSFVVVLLYDYIVTTDEFHKFTHKCKSTVVERTQD